MRILVTGASGYLGLHLVGKLLEAGHAVTAVVRSPARLGRLLAQPKLEACVVDLEDGARVEQAVAGHDACVHAALVWGEPETDLELRDTVASAKLFDAAGRAGVARTLFVSSTAVHRPFRARMTEADAVTTADVYGAIKASAEHFLWAACAAHAMDGLVVRAGPIVGPPALPEARMRSPGRFEQFLRSARRGEPVHVAERDGRQFVSVFDLADAIVRLLLSPRAQETYLCVAREFTSWEWIARRIVQRTRSTSLIVVEAPLATVSPTFDPRKLTEHLGIELTSRAALETHLELLDV